MRILLSFFYRALIMASYLHIFPLISLFFLITTSLSHKPTLQQNAMFLKVTKDTSTLQYLTHIHKGTPTIPTKLVVDLGGPFIWEACSSTHESSSYQPIHSTSLGCSLAKSDSSSCFTRGKTCDLPVINSITRSTVRGELAEDIMSFDHLDKSGLSLRSVFLVKNYLFVRVPSLLLNGLASGTKGVLGFGRTRTALPSQLQIDHSFYLCLSSSDGVIYFTDNHPTIPLSYTPLIPKQAGTSGDYYINMRSIKVNDYRISIKPILLSQGVKISTVVPYTTMESSIYNTFTSAYIRAATAMNLTRVAASPPFGVCFMSGSIENTEVGATVPVIDFELQSVMVTWRFYGRNSMVHVSDQVMCLGFLDGGVSPSDGVVIGGYQVEDHLLEFNSKTSILGFSSSLLKIQTCCSAFSFL